MGLGGAPPEIIEITPEIADRIYRILVRDAKADPDLRLAFMHHMSDTGTGLGQDDFRLKATYYGVTHFSICDNEWIVKPTNEDITWKTRQMVDTTNLSLALLKDEILAAP